MVLLAEFPGEPPHTQDQHYGATVTGQSAFPDFEYLQKALPGTEIIVETVEKAMAQTGTDQGTKKQGVKERVEKVLADLLSLTELREYPIP